MRNTMSNSLDCCQLYNQGKIGGLLEFLCQSGLKVLKDPFCSIMCDENAGVGLHATGESVLWELRFLLY